MKRVCVALAGMLCIGLGAKGASSETLEAAFQRVSSAMAAAQQTRTRSEFTENKVPVRLGACTEPGYYKDTLERPRVAMELSVTFCREKVTFDERADGTEGRGIFRRTKWVRVPGSEKTSYEYENARENFDLAYSPDSFRTPQVILRDLRDACQGRYDQLSLRILNERAEVRCR